MRFEDLRLAEPIVRAVAREGYTHPTPIQAKAIPHVLAGSDLLGCARTGTGKTAAFALPILHRLAAVGQKANAKAENRKLRAQSRAPRALILCPTRELASQIGESFRVYGRDLHMRYTTVFGGMPQHPQVRALRAGVDILIATPGRLMDLMNQGHVDLRAIEMFVLDEADRMLDMGFIHDIRKIVAHVPRKRQTLLFSATMPADIRALAASILNDAVAVQVDPESSTVQTIEQSVYHVAKKNKSSLLESILRGEASGRTLVFTRTKHGADKVVKGLLSVGIRAAAIHGNKSQNNRTRALAAFKSKSPPVLVATDIASRGIDVDEITHVINFDMPGEPETYIHRIGRTARAGASGAAVSFCDAEERGSLRAIERLTGAKLTVRTDRPEHATMPHADEEKRFRNGSNPAKRGTVKADPRSGRRANKRANSPSPQRSAADSPRVAETASAASNKNRRGIHQRGRASGRSRSRAGARVR